jgi:hypothetical protein
MKTILNFLFCRGFILLAVLAAVAHSATAQNAALFFAAGDLSGEPDRFGNTHTVGPAEAIEPLSFGAVDLLGVAINEDNKWLLYPIDGNVMLASHAPPGLEDSPELTMEIQVTFGGEYEVILHFLDELNNPGSAPIQAALGDGEMMEYSEANATPATGGTSPGFPGLDGATEGTMWWQTVSLGQVDVPDGGTITVRVDDALSDSASPFVSSTFQGVTLLTGAIPELQVSPGEFEWVSDASGNQYKTGPLDQGLTMDDWLTVNANSNSDNRWNLREGLGPYGPILESFPSGGDDAPALQTSIIFAQGGIYSAFFSLGDTGAADPDENLQTQNPLNFALEGEEFTRWHANDGEFKGTPGYNDYEMPLGELVVRPGEQVNFLIDDVQDGSASRSVYLGMRLELVSSGFVPFQVTEITHNQDKSPTVDLVWNSRPLRLYSVWTSTDLQNWIEVDDGVPSAGESTSYPGLPVAPNDPHRFFRVEETQ